MPVAPRRVAMTFAATIALFLGACGSNNAAESTGEAAGATSAEATEALETAYTGVTGSPPTTSTKAKDGVSLWVVSCGEQVPSCSTPVAGVQEAAKLIGWDVKVCDGQLNPNGWGTCIRQAASGGADVVIPVGIDCAAVQAPLQEAKAAGVKLVGGGGSDCDATGGEKLLDSERLQLENTSIKDYWKLNGKLQADWIIGKTDGKAKVVLLNFTDPVWGPWITEGFKEELATCTGCEIVQTLDIANADTTNNTAATKFSTALLQAPTANAVSIPIGGWMSLGLSQAIVSSGRSAQLNVVTGFGNEVNMDLIRDDKGQDAVLGYATEWGSYGSVDTAIRVVNGEQPLVQGDGFQIVDADHNLPATAGEDYAGSVDYKTVYKKAWGVS
ncbi:sugar ABC transporter substrate-binding protein [Actinoplanes subglobosus]|uniref:Sugar ABC transporter substrate-binding protein n=1 Tax=Actinoplanes subglobosus TaxID=1547892 RepID=A0ABV8IH89_9ACTN